MNTQSVQDNNILLIKIILWVLVVLCIIMFLFVAAVSPNAFQRSALDLDKRLLFIDHTQNMEALKLEATSMARMASFCTEASIFLYKIILVGYIIIVGMCGVVIWKLRL